MATMTRDKGGKETAAPNYLGRIMVMLPAFSDAYLAALAGRLEQRLRGIDSDSVPKEPQEPPRLRLVEAGRAMVHAKHQA